MVVVVGGDVHVCVWGGVGYEEDFIHPFIPYTLFTLMVVGPSSLLVLLLLAHDDDNNHTHTHVPRNIFLFFCLFGVVSTSIGRQQKLLPDQAHMGHIEEQEEAWAPIIVS